MMTTEPGFHGDSEANGRSVPADWRKRGVYSSQYFRQRHCTQSLAAASGLAPARVWAAESGVGLLGLEDLERLAVALDVKVVELFRPAGRTEEERVVLAMLDGEGQS